MLKKLLIAAGLGGIVYWFTKGRSKDEFGFTEDPPEGRSDSQ